MLRATVTAGEMAAVDATVTAGLPHAQVADMGRSLDFYLGLGCEVRHAADGWVLLWAGPVEFVLVQATGGEPPPRELSVAGSPWIRLGTPDAEDEIIVTDPDRRPVVIGPAEGPAKAPRRPPVRVR